MKTTTRHIWHIILVVAMMLPLCHTAHAGKKPQKKVQKKQKAYKAEMPDKSYIVKIPDASNRKAAADALGKVISRFGKTTFTLAFTDQLIEQYYSKDGEFIAMVADQWFYTGQDSTLTWQYIDRAVVTDPANPRPYEIAGDLTKAAYRLRYGEKAPSATDTVNAVRWYERGMAAAPADPRCYEKYQDLMSTVDPLRVDEKMALLAKANPSYNATLSKARMYYGLVSLVEGDAADPEVAARREKYPQAYAALRQNMQKAMDAYSQVRMTEMEHSDITNYMVIATGLRRYTFVVDTLAAEALAIDAEDINVMQLAYRAAGNQAATMSLKEGKPWRTRAIEIMQRMFASPKYAEYIKQMGKGNVEQEDYVRLNDQFSYAQLYEMNRDKEGMRKAYLNVMTMPLEHESQLSANVRRAAAKKISGDYELDGDFDSAIDVLQQSKENMRERGMLNLDDYTAITESYDAMLKEVFDEQQKIAIYSKFADVYDEMYQLPGLQDGQRRYIAWWAFVYRMQSDEKKANIAREQAERFIALFDLMPEGKARDSQLNSVAYAYAYQAHCQWEANNNAEAVRLAKLALKYNPNNTLAQNVVKYAKVKKSRR